MLNGVAVYRLVKVSLLEIIFKLTIVHMFFSLELSSLLRTKTYCKIANGYHNMHIDMIRMNIFPKNIASAFPRVRHTESQTTKKNMKCLIVS